MFAFQVRKLSRVFALSPERSGIRVGSVINCIRPLTIGKCLYITASRASDIRRVGKPVWVVDIEITKNDDFRMWRLKSNSFN